MSRKLSVEEITYVRDNPGRVWRYWTGDLVVTVHLPEMSEPENITRMRLAAGVAGAFHGPQIAPLTDYMQCAFSDPLIVIEVGLRGRDYGVVLREQP